MILSATATPRSMNGSSDICSSETSINYGHLEAVAIAIFLLLFYALALWDRWMKLRLREIERTSRLHAYNPTTYGSTLRVPNTPAKAYHLRIDHHPERRPLLPGDLLNILRRELILMSEILDAVDSDVVISSIVKSTTHQPEEQSPILIMLPETHILGSHTQLLFRARVDVPEEDENIDLQYLAVILSLILFMLLAIAWVFHIMSETRARPLEHGSHELRTTTVPFSGSSLRLEELEVCIATTLYTGPGAEIVLDKPARVRLSGRRDFTLYSAYRVVNAPTEHMDNGSPGSV
ncbi:hypothetical protein EV360DRAFT_79027 [Lentinula raphanica]|nr:hypothetical protein EV360DRAFT_79027 [Lentinula raphanica]